MVAETSPESKRVARHGLRAVLAGALLVGGAAAAGCGGSARPVDQRPIHGSRLAIYASAPLHGPDRQVGDAVLRAQRLALRQDGGRIGDYRVQLVTLDAARPFTGGTDPAKVSLNARRAAADPHAVAYLGEVRSGASAVSIPLLNEAGILQVSPLDSALGLTRHSTAITGSPVRYYPNAKRVGRTFARLVPSDAEQAVALLDDMAAKGVRRIAVLTDEDASGLALADAVRAVARRHGIAVVLNAAVDGHAQEHPDLIADIGAQHPDAVLYAGGMQTVAVGLWRELAAGEAGLRMFVPSELADTSFAAGVAATGLPTFATRPLLSMHTYPPAARRFARAYSARYGDVPPTEALYGYAAMRDVLAALRSAERAAAGDPLTRSDVVRAFFAEGPHDGVLGPYDIDRHGDTSLNVWGGFRLLDGQVLFERPL